MDNRFERIKGYFSDGCGCVDLDPDDISFLIDTIDLFRELVEEAYEEGADDMKHGHQAFWSECESKKKLDKPLIKEQDQNV